MNFVLLYFLVMSFFIASPSAEATCDVVPIVVWSGSLSQRVQELLRPVGLVVVTHTVTAGCDTDEECTRIAIAIRNRHIRQGLEDVALSFLVGGNGKIYEGAGWKVGSHTRGYNEQSVSLSFIGNFNKTIPSEAALKTAKNFLGCFLNTRYLSCEYKLVGHRQLISTASPGNALQNLIQTWPHWTTNVLMMPD